MYRQFLTLVLLGLPLVLSLGCQSEFGYKAPKKKTGITQPIVEDSFNISSDKSVIYLKQEADPTITFTGNCNLSSSPLITWEYGDGRLDQGVRVSHIYNRAGTYTVKSTCKSGTKQLYDQLQITVYDDYPTQGGGGKGGTGGNKQPPTDTGEPFDDTYNIPGQPKWQYE